MNVRVIFPLEISNLSKHEIFSRKFLKRFLNFCHQIQCKKGIFSLPICEYKVVFNESLSKVDYFSMGVKSFD